MNKQFPQVRHINANKYMNRYSTSLVARKMPNKTIKRYYFTCSKTVMIKRIGNEKYRLL